MAEATGTGKASKAVNVYDLRAMAQRRLPDVVFDYLDGGAEGEITLRSNTQVFCDVTFRPRHAVYFEKCSLKTRVLGNDLALPFLLAPVGYSRLMHPDGEAGAAHEAGAAGTAYILSTISGHALEKVKAASSGPVFYQLYLMGGRQAAEGAIERARKAGFSALAVTIDTAVAGLRERDFRNGMKEILGGSVWGKIPHMGQFFAHPGWLAGYVGDGGMPKLANVIVPGEGPMSLIDVGAALAKSVVTWEDFKWIREVWGGPIIAKSVLTGDDARRAIDAGASAVVVSNHGGRQLDCVSATLKALPEVVRAVNGQVEVLLDGGVRRGSDIVKALCLGARAVLVGRAYAYGLAAAGKPGVRRAIEILKADLERTLRLLGCPSVGELNREFLDIPPTWQV
jgi:isopentenyl diphosphate isomerase/L-lactate dehydrogenase-like FMN-dependent dehydrogenase